MQISSLNGPYSAKRERERRLSAEICETVETQGLRLAVRECIGGCGATYPSGEFTREHVLPSWIRNRVTARPNNRLSHYGVVSSGQEFKYAHDMDNLVVRKVCAPCNHGWMSALEGRAKPLLESLVDGSDSVPTNRPLIDLSEENAALLSRWAIKTALKLLSIQSAHSAPNRFAQELRASPDEVPSGCIVAAGLINQFHATGFNYLLTSDEVRGQAVHIRVSMFIDALHLVVVLPLDEDRRLARIQGDIHTPIWPRSSGFIQEGPPMETFEGSVPDLLWFLTGLVQASIAGRK